MAEFKHIVFCILAMVLLASCSKPRFVYCDDNCSQVAVPKGRTIILPMSDEDPEVMMIISSEHGLVGTHWMARLATEKIDYYIPYTPDEDVTIQIHDLDSRSIFFKKARFGKFKVYNPKPYLHFKPAYGWTNDPNGLVYHNGLWHLFYQFNPFGTKWSNMSWGHAVSKDLLTWEHYPVALLPDEIGYPFSGSAISKGDTLVTMFTSAGETQTQSLAFSTDGGRSFEKYAGNPVLTSSQRTDFRDPKIFWYEPEQKWCVVIGAGDGVDIYSSRDMINWSFESRFGEGIGCHGSVWECPDLFPLYYNGEEKWVLVTSVTRSLKIPSSQYFIGQFDGKTFVEDDKDTRWIDHGTDFYAAVTWNGAPDGRRVLLAWMTNWGYANVLPTVGYRGMMSTPRELSLGMYNGRMIMKSLPVREVMDNVRPECIHRYLINSETPEINLIGLTIGFDFSTSQFYINRFGKIYSEAVEDVPEHSLLVIEADNGVECFVDDGALCMSVLAVDIEY